jgi:hypothetical protein
MNLLQANVIELAANAVRTSTLTGSAVDVRKYAGMGQIILSTSAATAGTTPTLNVKIQESATSGGSYTDVPGATFSQVTGAADLTQMIPFDFDACKGFVKVIGTIAGTDTPTYGFSVTAVANRQAGRNSSQSV